MASRTRSRSRSESKRRHDGGRIHDSSRRLPRTHSASRFDAFQSWPERRTWSLERAREGLTVPATFFKARPTRGTYINPPKREALSRSNTESFFDRVQGITVLAPMTRSVPLTVCRVRQIRREVLHARGIAGRSGLNGPRYTEKSSVRCD